MEGLDHGFGLMPDPAGSGRIETEWADLCTALAVARDAREDHTAVARALGGRADCAPAAASVFQQVLSSAGTDSTADRLAPLVGRVVAALPPAALQRVLAAMDVPDRTSFLSAAIAAFDTDAVLALCTAAGAAFDRPLSEPLLRLLHKLRMEAESLPDPLRRSADQSFRALVLHVVDAWAAATVTTAATGFDEMFAQQRPQKADTRVTPEPLRVVQLALESGAIGNVVWGAVADQTRSEAGMRAMFDMLKRVPADNSAAAAILNHLATPGRLTNQLREEPVDFDAVDIIIRAIGTNAARPLIDGLAEAKQRATRRAIMDRLAAMGPGIGPAVLERIEDDRWFVLRNMIALLREAGCTLDQVPIRKLRAHSDARVRRETLQLQLETPETRDQALAEALADSDRHVLRIALQAARSKLPESAVPALARRALEPDFPPEFRVIALFLLGRSGSIHALEPLLAYVQGGRTLMGRPKLAPKSPEMLAALGGLARAWPNERRAAALLDLARQSKDEQILNALRATPGAASQPMGPTP
jgi:hypothetical protein